MSRNVRALPRKRIHKVVRRTLWLNVYHLDRHYGGPEEGGWWYDTWTPVDCRSLGRVPVRYADSVSDRVRQAIPSPDYPIHSVMYGGGQFVVMAEPQRGRHLPRYRPVYS